MSEVWRCFVAVGIGERLRRELAVAVDAWRARPDLAELRWTDPGAWHLTLAFLGPVPSEAVPGLNRRLESVASAHEPMRLATGGLGSFPSPARARVAWYGIVDPEGGLADLAGDVAEAVGVERSDGFRPHLTLARSRSEGGTDLRTWIAETSAPTGELAVEAMSLMRSHLGRGPAAYEVVGTATLAGTHS